MKNGKIVYEDLVRAGFPRISAGFGATKLNTGYSYMAIKFQNLGQFNFCWDASAALMVGIEICRVTMMDNDEF